MLTNFNLSFFKKYNDIGNFLFRISFSKLQKKKKIEVIFLTDSNKKYGTETG